MTKEQSFAVGEILKDLEKEVYTLEEIRLMKALDGQKKLVFLIHFRSIIHIIQLTKE